MRGKHIAVTVSFLALTGCSMPTFDDLTLPASVFANSGDGQTGVVGEKLARPLVVDAVWGQPNAPQPEIVWTVETGGGSIAPMPRTSAGGYPAIWTLGPTPGKQTVRATWTNSGETPAPYVVFQATAVNPQ